VVVYIQKVKERKKMKYKVNDVVRFRNDSMPSTLNGQLCLIERVYSSGYSVLPLIPVGLPQHPPVNGIRSVMAFESELFDK
jgi:hypothetical protein